MRLYKFYFTADHNRAAKNNGDYRVNICQNVYVTSNNVTHHNIVQTNNGKSFEEPFIYKIHRGI